MFTSEKHGYAKKEVDEKVNELLNENAKLRQQIIEKDKLNLGLASALEKARQIELSAQNLYDLKTQKVLIMCKNLERRFQKLFKIYPQIQEFDDLKEAFDDFSAAISGSFNGENGSSINSPVKTENDTIRLLLGKMGSYTQPEQPAEKKVAKKTTTKSTAKPIIERSREKIYDKPSQIKPICGNEISGGEEYENLADKFLQTLDNSNSVYSKIINTKRDDDMFPTPNESGFDLKEAVNPTENLEDIMKAFDFSDL